MEIKDLKNQIKKLNIEIDWSKSWNEKLLKQKIDNHLLKQKKDNIEKEKIIGKLKILGVDLSRYKDIKSKISLDKFEKTYALKLRNFELKKQHVLEKAIKKDKSKDFCDNIENCKNFKELESYILELKFIS